VTQPYKPGAYLRARHMEQQSEMAAMLVRRFGDDPRVAYVNLGDAIDVNDPALSYDGMHLTAAGNTRLAESLVAPVVRMRARRSTTAGRVEH